MPCFGERGRFVRVLRIISLTSPMAGASCFSQILAMSNNLRELIGCCLVIIASHSRQKCAQKETLMYSFLLILLALTILGDALVPSFAIHATACRQPPLRRKKVRPGR